MTTEKQKLLHFRDLTVGIHDWGFGFCGDARTAILEFWDYAKHREEHFFVFLSKDCQHIDLSWPAPGSKLVGTFYRYPLKLNFDTGCTACSSNLDLLSEFDWSVKFDGRRGIRVYMYVMKMRTPFGKKFHLMQDEALLKLVPCPHRSCTKK